ncbi:MAG: CvpA family protein [Bacteroidota bacterium]|nr:CvpA family protein [Bacteroidota bacterium]
MNTTDILIVVGILLFVVLGIRDGFFKKIFGILGFLGGLICATKFMVPFAETFIDWIGFSEEISLILAFFIIFILFVVLVNLFYHWFGQSGSGTIELWSRIIGGILGFAQGLVAVSLVLVMFSFYDIPTKEDRSDSFLYKDTIKIAPNVFNYMTKWIPDSKMFFEEIKDKISNVKLP